MLLYGKALAESIIDGIKKEVVETGITPRLGIVLVGNQKPSEVYVRRKVEDAKTAGIRAEIFRLPESADEDELLALVRKLNKDRGTDGFIVQLPLPGHIDEDRVIEAIEPAKDVDGFHPANIGKVALGLEGGLEPATPSGVMMLLAHYKIPLAGVEAVVVGRSNIVGKPVALMLLRSDATVTICHSRTANLASHTRRADVLIVAAGKAGLVKPDMVKEGACVIDVGINHVGGRLVGDVAPEVQEKARLSPVPGGVGPMTRAMLLLNTLKAAKARRKGK